MVQWEISDGEVDYQTALEKMDNHVQKMIHDKACENGLRVYIEAHFASTNLKVELTENTRKDNSRFFDSIDDVPTHAYTMGIESIMRAKQIYLLASGKHKKEILEKACHGEITSDVPASFLQEHNNVEVLYCD